MVFGSHQFRDRDIIDIAAGARRARLDGAIARLEQDEFLDRILPLDRNAAHEFGRIVARRHRMGRPMVDALIAAIAMSCRATLATRDISDFDEIGLALVNPFVPSVA